MIYKMPVCISVELFVSGQPTMKWNFPWGVNAWGKKQAQDLYDALTRIGDMLPSGDDEVGTPRPQTLNLVYWNRHPTQTDAIGLIVDQLDFDNRESGD